MRIKRLIAPSTIAGIAGITLGLVIGINAGLHTFKTETMKEYDISIQQWGRFQGYLFSLMPSALGGTIAFYALSQLLLPGEKGDRAAVKRMAEQKLLSATTDEELVLWSKVAQEVESER